MKSKMKRETRSLPPIIGVASLSASTIDREARTVDLIFYSGATVFRAPMFDEPYELEFEVSRKAAQLGRLNGGASLIDSHQVYGGVGSILGVVERAWIADGQAHATVRFSQRADVEPVWQDVLDGIVRNVSMGAYLLEMEEVTEKGAPLKRFRATSWEPYEISLVAVPADAGAQVLEAESAETRPCRISFSASACAAAPNGAVAPTSKGNAMKIKVRLTANDELVEIDEKDFDAKLHSEELGDEKPAAKAKPATQLGAAVEDEKVTKHRVDDAIERDQKNAGEIKRAAEHFGLDVVWARRHINLGTPIAQVLELASEERAKRAPKTTNDIGFGNDYDSQQWRGQQMEAALEARALRKEPPEAAKQYAKSTFVECALECLGWARQSRGLDVRSDASRIVELALHHTSDFPLLLGNVLNKIMLPAYATANPTYRMISAQKQFSDFRPHRFMRAGDFPIPQLVGEHGEFKYGTMSETEEQVTLATYGRIIGFSRQSLINDDLGAFADLGVKAARRIVDFENAQFYTTCILPAAGLGATLSAGNGGVAVYNAAHANITAAGALSNTLLGSAFALMMAQTGLDGLKLNVTPRFVLVSPTSFVLAKTLMAAITPNQASQVNPFAGEMVPIADANLGTGTRFYVLASPEQLPNYIYGYLGGAAGPRTDVRAGFEIDGVEFKIALDFAVGTIDYRGGVTGAGA